MLNESLSEKRAVVTGVTSGIGAALVDRLIEAGALVAGVGRTQEKLDERAARWGARFIPVLADLAKGDARRGAVEQISAQLERVDVLVNNAAECVYASPVELSPLAWEALVQTNVLAVVELCSGLAPRLSEDAQVVNVSSVVARSVPSAKFGPYAVTKAALDRFTEALRLELAPRGVRVSLLAPGLVDTPIYDKVAGFAPVRATLTKQVPTWLTDADVADALVWMLTRPQHVAVSELVLMPRGQTR
jgi:NADP-dependent 3-hydroxy acid dehydrogenase YdfG